MFDIRTTSAWLSKAFADFLGEGKYKYNLGVKKLVYKPGLSIAEFLDIDIVINIFRLHVFNSIST